ncbi:MAG: glycosyltransferase family 2 protein, partial [Anaerolineales bacterium]
PEIGIVGAKILGPKWEIQHAGMILGLGGPAGPIFEGAHEYIYSPYGSPESYRNYMAVTGSCMAVRREVFEQLGGFDEVYRSAYGDIDLCLRAAEAGFRVVYTPYCRVQTQTSDSIDKGIPESDVTRITQAISQFTLNGDPYFNPNLSYRWLIPQIKENEGS